MKIFLDTNIIVSAIMFPRGVASMAYIKAVSNHRCCICEKTLYELRNVFRRKFPEHIETLENFIKISLKTWEKFDDEKLPIELENTIRDEKDRILYRTAKANGCDAILTGDNDFKDNNLLDIDIIVPQDILNDDKSF